MSRAQQFLVPLLGADEAVVLPWYNPDPDPDNRALIQARIDAGGFWAWRAQSNDEDTWGAGPADYAASLISVEGNAVSLVEGNGAVPWTALTGWDFTAALLKYFDTTIVPGTDWAAFIQFSSVTNTGQLFGSSRGLNRQISVRPNSGVATYWNGGSLGNAPVIVAGNTGIVDRSGYRNGVLDVGPIGAWSVAAINPIFIGALNNFGSRANLISGSIVAYIMCDTPAAILPSIASLASLPDGSMHNL